MYNDNRRGSEITYIHLMGAFNGDIPPYDTPPDGKQTENQQNMYYNLHTAKL